MTYPRVSYWDLREGILKALSESKRDYHLTRLAHLNGVDNSRVRTILQELIKEGKIEAYEKRINQTIRVLYKLKNVPK